MVPAHPPQPACAPGTPVAPDTPLPQRIARCYPELPLPPEAGHGARDTGLIGPWGWIGVVPLLTAGIGWCPLYTVLGINTCGLKR